jgi:hypothetical protein
VLAIVIVPACRIGHDLRFLLVLARVQDGMRQACLFRILPNISDFSMEVVADQHGLRPLAYLFNGFDDDFVLGSVEYGIVFVNPRDHTVGNFNHATDP